MAVVASAALPLNFPQDFLLDRTMLSRLLGFAAKNGSGNKLAISQATGIPTGKSTGKVEPMIRYALGMGLLLADYKGGEWNLKLSNAGKLIFDEDPYLDESATQWFCHLMLCRRVNAEEPPKGIAEPWFTLFAEGASRLGNPFKREAFRQSLIERHGDKSYLRSLSGLVPRTYLESRGLATLGILTSDNNGGTEGYRRSPALDRRELYPAYTSAFFLAWDLLYQGRQQVPIKDLLHQSRILATLQWQFDDAERWIQWMCERGHLRLDNLTGVPMGLRLAVDAGFVVNSLYDEVA